MSNAMNQCMTMAAKGPMPHLMYRDASDFFGWFSFDEA